MSSELSIIYEFGRFRLDRENRRLTRDGLLHPVPANTLQLLLMLVEKPDEILSTEDLTARLFPKSTFAEEELATKILELRRLLEDTSKENPMVRWMPGKGYRFEAAVTAFLGDSASPLGSAREEEERAKGAPPPPADRMKIGRMLGVAAAVILLTTLGVWGWHFMSAGASTGAVSKQSSPIAGSSQIAVLPFGSLSGSPADERFDSALTAALIHALADSQVQVVPAAAVEGYTKATPVAQLAAGRALGVEIMVLGMAQPLAGRVRVKVQMVRTEDEVQVWTGDFDGDSKDIAGLAAQISEPIGKEIHILGSEKTPQ
jgi:DNA-binding winged helix-turn-helix (wHTH) protein/TolB-like protein